jgi:arylsulfatase A-like enzyme
VSGLPRGQARPSPPPPEAPPPKISDFGASLLTHGRVNDEETTAPPSPRGQVGEPALLGLLAAALAAVPSVIRAAGGEAGVAGTWLVATTLWAALLVPVSLLIPRAARGLRGLVGPGPRPDLAAGVALWASFSSVGLLLLGGLLHAKTHHRGLGGATFGIGGAVILVVSAVAAGRLVLLGRALVEGGLSRAVLGVVPWVAAFAALALLALPLAKAPGEAPLVRAAMGDGLVGVAWLAVLLSREWPDAVRRALGMVGVPLTALTMIAGGAHLETSTAGAALARAGGVPGVLVELLTAWSDRDGDGHAAHFGGRDCDEGDPKRHPGAVDVPGDGIDSDCDGREVPAPEHRADAVASAPSASNSARPAPTATSSASATPSPSAEGASPSAPSGAKLRSSDPRPDVIVVTLDTVRADRTSLYGFTKKTTPVLEKLAAEGIVFEHAFAVAGDPQRALTPIVSGRPYSETPHGPGEWPVIDDNAETVAERLRPRGYRTGAVTSFTWLRKDRGFAQGFELFDEAPFRENHPERKVTGARAIDAAIAMHGELASGEAPLYLWVHLFDAHARYLPHDGLSFGSGDEGLYLGEIAYVDRELGRLVEAVRSSARGKHTVWIVHGSHGEAFGEHGASGHGASVFDEVLRVPLLVAGAGVSPSRPTTAVSTMDVAATVLELANAEARGLAGVSLAPAMRGTALTRPPLVAHAYRRVAVIDWPLKLIHTRLRSGKESLALYDLAADPAEKDDLARTRPDDVKRLDALRAASAGAKDEADAKDR